MHLVHLPKTLFIFLYVLPSLNAYTLNFPGRPNSPSQRLLPTSTLDFVVTHRTHPKEHFTRVFNLFPGDHDLKCAGPNPNKKSIAQHSIRTTHVGRGYAPDQAFYICNNHLMTAMGDVSPYSIASFFPKAQWVFTGEKLSFSVSNNAKRRRHWFEILIAPRNLLTVAGGPDFAPIDEGYPKDYLVLRFFHGERFIEAGARTIGEKGSLGKIHDLGIGRFQWHQRFPNDKSYRDRRIRIEHVVTISKNRRSIKWATKPFGGKWDFLTLRLKAALRFDKGVVQFKTHSYTPTKDRNMNDYTDHWGNITFGGRMTDWYKNYEAKDVVYLQRNGDRQVGETEMVSINVDKTCPRAVLFGQVHQPVKGEVLLSVNGASDVEVKPYAYTNSCAAYGWMSFQMSLSNVKRGKNTFRWTIGKRVCNKGNHWIGFSIKSLEIQCSA